MTNVCPGAVWPSISPISEINGDAVAAPVGLGEGQEQGQDKEQASNQSKIFLDHRSRKKRCELLVWLGDRFSRPRPKSPSIFRYT